MRVAHLLVKHRGSRNPRSWKEDPVTRSKEEAIAMIEAFHKQLLAGEVDFQTLASKESHCGSAKNGGDLGEFQRGSFLPSFEEACLSLKEVGEIVGPVDTDSGIHLITMTAK